MNDTYLRESLGRYVTRIENLRDEAYARAQESGHALSGQWAGGFAYELALDTLHAATRGDYGTPYNDQPEQNVTSADAEPMCQS